MTYVPWLSDGVIFGLATGIVVWAFRSITGSR